MKKVIKFRHFCNQYFIGDRAEVKRYLPFFNKFIFKTDIDTTTIYGSLVIKKSLHAVGTHSFSKHSYPQNVGNPDIKMRSITLC